MTIEAPAPEHTSSHFDDDAIAFLVDLLDTPAPSGYEDAAGDAFLARAATFADVERDAVGNCFATVNRGAGPRLVIAGHLDEIGFVVTRVTDQGLLRFEAIGGWDAAVAVGQRVRVTCMDGTELVGTIGRLPTHQLPDDTGPLRLRDLWIDVGFATGAEAREQVRPGDFVVLATTPWIHGNGRVMSRSADNRVGTFIALEVARRSVGLPVEVVAAGTAGEETTQLGAAVTGWSQQPAALVVVDVTPATDVPGSHDEEVELGKGPALTIGAAAHAGITRDLAVAAAAAGIPLQRSGAGRDTGTDAEAMWAAGAGVRCGVVCVPCRYLHTPNEVFDLADVRATVELLLEWVQQVATS